MCGNQNDLRMTLADRFYGSDLRERLSPTSMRLVCIQAVYLSGWLMVFRGSLGGAAENACQLSGHG
jgi:hypothetical protein